VLLGAVLRAWQYLANSSLWIDELALARNLVERSFVRLLEPLDYAQVAPPGFLLVEKIAIAAFGTSEYSLRAFPFFCGLCSLVLFWIAAERILRGWAATFAVALFSLGIPFIYFSAQVKQYSSDVAAALCVLAATLQVRHRGFTARRAWGLGALGAVIVWFSQPAVFVLAGIGAGLLAVTLLERDRIALRRVLVTGALWAASAAAVVLRVTGAIPDLDRQYFAWFWADGFMPVPPRSLAELLWLPGKLTWAFGAFELGLGHSHGGLNYRWSPVFVVVMLCGFWALWRQRRDAALFLLLPVVVTIALSAASVYPFTARVIAFLIPSFLLATAAGAEFVLAHWPQRLQPFVAVFLALLGGPPLYAAATARPPAWLQHFRPVVEYVAAHRAPGDRIYVYYGANPAFAFYAPRAGLTAEGVQSGRCLPADPRGHLRDLDRLRGSPRVWVLATHLARAAEWDLIVGYLDRIGRRIDSITVAGSRKAAIEEAYGYLYDLSDPGRLAAASAETYEPIIEPVTGAVAFWVCYGVIGQPSY
jgi:hypothetical protein